MNISKEDKEESLRVSQLIKKIELIDEKYVKEESDIISKKQPFLISLILGFSLDLKPLELEEMMKIILLIWEFFKKHHQTKRIKITEKQYMRIQERNIGMLKYYEGERGEISKQEVVSTDLENLNSKSLFTGIIVQFNQKVALINMNKETRGIILLGMKTLN